MDRRGFLTGLTAVLAAASVPASVTALVVRRVPVMTDYDEMWLEFLKRMLEAYSDAFGLEPQPGSHEYEFICLLVDSTVCSMRALADVADSLVMPTEEQRLEWAKVMGMDHG